VTNCPQQPGGEPHPVANSATIITTPVAADSRPAANGAVALTG
jgi:hypothetical protein